jgi:hypothetical protein
MNMNAPLLERLNQRLGPVLFTRSEQKKYTRCSQCAALKTARWKFCPNSRASSRHF